MATLVDDREKRLAELRKEVTQRGFDRHASVLTNILELPVELQSPAVSALVEREAIQTIIMFPPQIQRGWHYVPKQALLFTKTDLIHLAASIWANQDPQVTCLKGCDLLYINVMLLLLYGSLEIVVQGANEPVRLEMEFNTVDWYCLAPPLQRFLQTAGSMLSTPADPDVSTNNDTYSTIARRILDELPLKFLNGLRIHGLLPGEELEEVVFQAGTWKRWLYFFQRPVLANTVVLLSSHYMVVIEEDLEVKQGWVLSYIPRRSILGIQNQPCGLWNKVSVQLKQEKQPVDYKLKLTSEVAETWCRQWVQHGGSWEDISGQKV